MKISNGVNNKKRKIQKAVDFQDYLAAQLKNPVVKKHYGEYGKQLEIAYRILQLRKQKRMSQNDLAKKIGTRQSNVARMESGRHNFSTDMLQRVAEALGKNLKIEFVK